MKIGLHGFGQSDPKMPLGDESGAAFAGLGVDPDEGGGVMPEISWIDAKIGNAPGFGDCCAQPFETLPDAVLMRPGEGGESEFANIRVAGMNGNLVQRRDAPG
jgi:hypothetical protein